MSMPVRMLTALLLLALAAPALAQTSDGLTPSRETVCDEEPDTCAQAPDGSQCDDGLWCNGQEVCDTGDGCQPGVTVDCDDNVACTDGICDEALDTCTQSPNDASCDDGLWCNGLESCHLTEGCQPVDGSAPSCDDGVSCTDDECDEDTDACTHTTNAGHCDDGLWCNGQETCDAINDCQAGAAPDCRDDLECTTETCDETTDTCLQTPNDAVCDDGTFCNGAETCDPVDGCQPGPAVDCDDGIDCTDGFCDEDYQECIQLPDKAFCDDDLFCNGIELCDIADGCISPAPPSCDDGISCTEDSCDEAGDTCAFVPIDADCDDDNFCNGAETCDPLGGCQPGVEPDCSDDDLCTTNGCDPALGKCTSDPVVCAPNDCAGTGPNASLCSEYFADVSATPLANMSGQYNYGTSIASSFIGSGSAGDISSVVAGRWALL